MLTTVAIQGIEGSYSDIAAESLFGLEAERLACESFSETLSAVSQGKADLAVIPTHNSIIGTIGGIDELVERYSLRKVRVAALEIRHVLIGQNGSEVELLKSVSSHKEALRQCAGFLSGNPNIEAKEDTDTASAVRRVLDSGDPTAAAIGSRRAAEIYGGTVLLDRVADRNSNFTTFCLVKK